jgi:prevent-host-death family protein
MKSIKVSELKAHLSRYLRLASRGTHIVVTDRNDPIAQLGPPEATVGHWQDRLAREGRLYLGTQAWESLRISPLPAPVNAQEALRAVREEPDEIRRR